MSIPANTTFIQKRLTEYFDINMPTASNPSTLWTAHKAFVRGVLIQLNAQTRRQRIQQLTELLNKIEHLKKINKVSPTHFNSDKIFMARNDLKTFLNDKHAKSLLKIRSSFYTAGNKAGKLLANQIKLRQNKNKILHTLHPSTGDKVYHPKDIANAFGAYYRTLYNLKDDPNIIQPMDSDTSDFLESMNPPKLSSEQLISLNAPLSIQEISQAISPLPSGKAPGPDSFSVKYYKLFNKPLTPHICDMFSTAVSSGQFPNEMLSANIVTLPKPGNKLDIPSNFRHISLLNTDLKLYARFIAQRLTPIMPHIIHPDQVGFTLGRQAPDATWKILNVLHFTEKHNISTLFITLDAEKAFDRIHWGYLKYTLAKFGFQGNIYYQPF